MAVKVLANLHHLSLGLEAIYTIGALAGGYPEQSRTCTFFLYISIFSKPSCVGCSTLENITEINRGLLFLLYFKKHNSLDSLGNVFVLVNRKAKFQCGQIKSS